MTGAPTWVDQTQLDELGIGLTEEALARREQPEEGEQLPPAER
jgi:hypothetical protein